MSKAKSQRVSLPCTIGKVEQKRVVALELIEEEKKIVGSLSVPTKDLAIQVGDLPPTRLSSLERMGDTSGIDYEKVKEIARTLTP
jgi:hypothetical protein